MDGWIHAWVDTWMGGLVDMYLYKEGKEQVPTCSLAKQSVNCNVSTN